MRHTQTLVVKLGIAFLLVPSANTLAMDRAPEMLDEAKAKLIWSQVSLAARDLDVLPDASFITGVFAIPSDSHITGMAAALASVVAFRDAGEGHSYSGDLSGDSGPFLLTVRQLLGTHAGAKQQEELPQTMQELWKTIHLSYNNDADQVLHKLASSTKISGGGLWARVIQSYYDQVREGTPQDRLRKSVLALAAPRDLVVTVSQEKGSRDRCQESIIRKMPFLCFFGNPDNPRPYVCVGYAKKEDKLYWIALNPSKCIGAPNGMAVTKIRANWRHWAPYTNDYKTLPYPEAVPGTVVLDAAPASFACMFIYNWRHDEKALAERVKRFLAAEKDRRKPGERP